MDQLKEIFNQLDEAATQICQAIIKLRELTGKELVLTPAEKLDFEAVYKLYPKKAGKTEGLARCKKFIKTEIDYKLLEQAVRRYAQEVKYTEPKYIKNFSTFIGTKEIQRWRDYIPERPERGVNSTSNTKRRVAPSKPKEDNIKRTPIDESNKKRLEEIFGSAFKEIQEKEGSETPE